MGKYNRWQFRETEWQKANWKKPAKTRCRTGQIGVDGPSCELGKLCAASDGQVSSGFKTDDVKSIGRTETNDGIEFWAGQAHRFTTFE